MRLICFTVVAYLWHFFFANSVYFSCIHFSFTVNLTINFQVVEGAPYVTTVETLDKYNCDFCVHGGKHHRISAVWKVYKTRGHLSLLFWNLSSTSIKGNLMHLYLSTNQSYGILVIKWQTTLSLELITEDGSVSTLSFWVLFSLLLCFRWYHIVCRWYWYVYRCQEMWTLSRV